VVPQLVEPDVAVKRHSHEQDQGRVEEDEAGLSDVGVVEEDEGGGEEGDDLGVAALAHDQVHHSGHDRAEDGAERAEADVGDVVGDVVVADVLELEVAVVADQPALGGEHQLGAVWRRAGGGVSGAAAEE
jgi:hypothetical protein